MRLPPHDEIAAECGVTLDAVRKWSSGARPAPAWAVELMRLRWPDLDVAGVVARWGGRWLKKNPAARLPGLVRQAQEHAAAAAVAVAGLRAGTVEDVNRKSAARVAGERADEAAAAAAADMAPDDAFEAVTRAVARAERARLIAETGRGPGGRDPATTDT